MSPEINIRFLVFEQGREVHTDILRVNPSDSSAVENMAVSYLRNDFGIFNSNKRALNVKNCFKRVTEDETNTILVFPKWEIKAKRSKPFKRKRGINDVGGVQRAIGAKSSPSSGTSRPS